MMNKLCWTIINNIKQNFLDDWSFDIWERVSI